MSNERKMSEEDVKRIMELGRLLESSVDQSTELSQEEILEAINMELKSYRNGLKTLAKNMKEQGKNDDEILVAMNAYLDEPVSPFYQALFARKFLKLGRGYLHEIMEIVKRYEE